MKKNTLTTSFLYNLRNADSFTELTYEDFFQNEGNPLAYAIRTDNEQEERDGIEYALTYLRLFNRKGQELVFDVRYQDNLETEQSRLVESFFNGERQPFGQPDQLQRSLNEEGETQLVAQLDYVHPFSKKGKCHPIQRRQSPQR